jgi:hypothetical protein
MTMGKRGSIACKLRPCLPKGPTNSARMRTIVTAALQQQYLHTELILWICLVFVVPNSKPITSSNPCVVTKTCHYLAEGPV